MTKEQWIKILKGAGISVAGALLSYATAVVIPAMQESGVPWMLILASAASVAVNIGLKYIQSLNTKKE